MAESYTVEAKLIADISQYTANLQRATRQMQGFSSDAGATSKQTSSSFASSFKGVLAGVGAFKVVDSALGVMKENLGGAIDRFDTLNAYPKVMKQLGYSTKDTNTSIKVMKRSIDGLPTSLQDITKSAQSFSILTGSATAGAKTAAALNDAFLASGASAADASRGVEQYSQMLAAGKPDMVGWRTMMETMPVSLKKVATSFGLTGKSAERDLYAKLKNGDITMDQLNKRFIELDGGVNGFNAMAHTASGGIRSSFTNMSNAVKNGMADMIKSIDNGLKSAGLGGFAALFDKAKIAINASFKSINGVITSSIPSIVSSIKTLVDFVKANQSWLEPLGIGVLAFLPFAGNVRGAFGSILKAFTGTKSSLAAGGGWLTPLVGGITDFLSHVPVFGGALSSVAGAIFGLKDKGVQAAGGIGQVVLSLLQIAPGATAGIGPIGGLVTAMGGLGQGTSLIGGFTGALGALGKFVPLVGGIISIALSPAGLGLIAAGTAFWALHDSGTESIGDLASQLMNGNITGALSSIKGFVDNVAQAFKQVDWATIGGIWQSGIQGIADSFSVFSTSSSTHTGKVKGDVQTTSDKIAELATFATVAFAAIGSALGILSTMFWGLMTVVEAVVRGIIALWDVAGGDISGAVSVMSDNSSAKMAEMSYKSTQAMMDMAQQGVDHMNSLRDGTALDSQQIHDLLTNNTATGSQNAVNNLNAAAGGGQAALGNLKQSTQTNMEATQSIMSGATAAGARNSNSNMNLAASGAQTAMSKAADAGRVGGLGIKDGVSNGTNAARNVLNANLGAAAGDAGNKMSQAAGAANSRQGEFRSAGANASRALGDGVESINLHAHGSSVMSSFLGGLKSAWGGVQSFINGVGPWIKAHKGPISYDKRLLIPAGNAIMDGLHGGLQTGFEPVEKTVANMAGAINSQFGGGFNYRINPVTNGMSMNTDGTMNMRLENQQQPAYVNLSMGNTVYRAFVDDISQQQGRKATLNSVASVY